MAEPHVISFFRAKNFKVLKTPEELKEWERLMREEVGFKADFSNLSGTCTECSCGGQSDDCDQD